MRKLTLIALVLSAFILAGVSTAMAKDTVELAYVEWSSEVASTNVVQAVLQEKMGYECEITPVSGAAMWQATATGDVDGLVAAWLPTTHGHYLEKVKDEVVDLGPNLEGTRIGLVVPEYVSIDSIDQINEYAEKFDEQIIGIDPGAGIMSATEEAVEEYNMDNIELMEGSGATMTAVLKNRIEDKEWVVVTGWTPHWKFAKWDLKYLNDPKGVYGGEEFISTIVRQGLKEDMPEVYEFLDNFYWAPEDMAEVMVWNQDGMDPYESAKKWISENPEKVEKWLP
ncbi:glycine betaine ABC transporter substrate-binding protein [Desulfohalobium retbaense]|uniref:Substrate-binding region of ABC-type glycine betaine transport system n=1 Tax=Desulfohalobium retbaense (strain ATCC 49708 / DSM 5692 / JCM 16813 / HR100) TaxID=485915 RepID=C8X558_DESRD|nr:glycine betaine ABC transporter substrate-binding protein [Desulfohalobium retbaense]ACV69555.1 Substrate-binding region of ABC-type glycine betaine transport system [Desulfohalobium retbaense DSM 5692]